MLKMIIIISIKKWKKTKKIIRNFKIKKLFFYKKYETIEILEGIQLL